jgi:hypothetical protein
VFTGAHESTRGHQSIVVAAHPKTLGVRESVARSSNGDAIVNTEQQNMSEQSDAPLAPTNTPAAKRTRGRRVVEIAWLCGVSSLVAALSVVMASVPTTREDFFIPGTQINKLTQRIVTANACAGCHGDYNEAHEPLTSWAASMMGQSARDPIFHACLTIANQDADFAGDLCLRCHVPGGWLQGRAQNPAGVDLTEVDMEGVSCNFCHRMVDPHYEAGQSPAVDQQILSAIDPPVINAHSGSYVMDPLDRRRGPYDISYLNPHPWLESPFHRSSNMCATCHDVSNPAYERQPDGTYTLGALNQRPISNNKYDQFPVERTFSEWNNSLFAQGPVEMGGRFGGNLSAVSSCQDCHMPKTTGTGCNPALDPIVREDLGRHNFNGANTWVLRAVRSLYDDSTTLLTEESVNASIARAQEMMRRASDLEVTQIAGYLNTRIINFTGHKLPTGYVEGRRMWINVQYYDAANTLIDERGNYDYVTADLVENNTKIYEAKQGLDAAGAALANRPEGPGFHFAVNNTYFKDNRIPPMGFTNAAFTLIQAQPVEYSYADGQYWDDTLFDIPSGATRAEVRVLHQTTTKEYITFLRDANVTNNTGQIAYDQWVLHGKSTPTEMDFVSVDISTCLADINGDGGVDGSDVEAFYLLWATGQPPADLNFDGGVDGGDVEAFFTLWSAGC